MGFLYNFLQTTFNAALGLVVGAAAINILFDIIKAAAPQYFSGQASELLASISGISIVSFLSGLTNNPFFGVLANGAAALGAISGISVLSSLSSSTQTYAQTVFIVAYVTFVYTNAIFFFAHWVPTVVQGLLIAPAVITLDDGVITPVFSVAEILYLLTALGYIPQGV
ncbi:hypothetical protein [Metallosphaera sp.]|uniref:hypothetical protein n=1 Tax=Metallosphaera sp. TaxID=2020860 RepID=UPI003173F4DF